jgi:DNA mismatch endonuclease (patch repair protein)
MPDSHDKKTRSRVMSKIRSQGNKSTELRLIKLMRLKRIKGWRRNYPLLGKPDFVFPNQRIAIFVDGCFWHGCTRCYIQPKTNEEYWVTKRITNRKRDRLVNRTLKKQGWYVFRVWEHEFIDEERLSKRLCAVITSKSIKS